MIASGHFPPKGTEGQSECGFECEGGKYPHTQTQTHAVFLGVGLSTHALLWPFLHTHTQTHAVFLGVGLSTHASLWPFPFPHLSPKGDYAVRRCKPISGLEK